MDESHHGLAIPPTPLSNDFQGAEIIQIIHSEKELSAVELQVIEIEDTPGLPIKVPNNLTRPHSLIVDAKKGLLNRDRHINDGHIWLRNGEIDINVSPSKVGRALRLMDTLLKLFIARGHHVINRNRETFAVIFGEEIQIRLFETRKIVEAKERYGRRTYVPTGIFKLQYDRSWRHKEFIDGRKPLELNVAKILVTLEILAKEEIEERIRHKKEKKIWEEEQKIIRENEERHEKELSDFVALIQKVNRWHYANILRNFIVEFKINSAGARSENFDVEPLVKWASEKADWYDPFIEKDDIILEPEDRAKIDQLIVNKN